MAVTFRIVTGTMGGGKTLYVVEECIKGFKDGAVVISNIDWKEDQLKERGWDKLHVRLPDNPEEWIKVLVRGTEDKPNILAVDEAAMIFHTWDVSDSKKKDRALFDVLVMTRKLGISCFFITQALENLSSPIRRIANYIMHCVAVKHIPMVGPMVAPFFPFLRVTKTAAKQVTLWTAWARLNKEACETYQTDAIRGAAETVTNENQRATVVEPRVPWSVKIIIAIILLVLGWGAYHFGYEVPKKIRAQEAEREEKLKTKKAPTAGMVGDKGQPKVSEKSAIEQGRPQLHPFSEPSGIKFKEMEWDEQDERIRLAAYTGTEGKVYLALGGERFFVGAFIEGDVIAQMIEYAGNVFAISQTGRVFYIRSRTYNEKRQYQEYVTTLAQLRQAQTQSPPPTPPPTPITQ